MLPENMQIIVIIIILLYLCLQIVRSRVNKQEWRKIERERERAGERERERMKENEKEVKFYLCYSTAKRELNSSSNHLTFILEKID